jgi:hypothetical protein
MFGDLYQLPPVVDSDELHFYLMEQHSGPLLLPGERLSASSGQMHHIDKKLPPEG